MGTDIVSDMSDHINLHNASLCQIDKSSVASGDR